MTLDELLAHIAAEPERVGERDVRVPARDLLAEIHQRRGIRLTDLMSDPRQTIERRTFRIGHLLGPGVSPTRLADWNARWPRHPLPADLVGLLLRVNGIHFWADLETGRSYDGLAPLDEWDLTRVKMWGPDADEASLADRYLALSYHSEGAAFIVLNVETGRYYLMDSAGPDESCLVGASVGDLLDWLWDHRISP